jgi:hypothetical protein
MNMPASHTVLQDGVAGGRRDLLPGSLRHPAGRSMEGRAAAMRSRVSLVLLAQPMPTERISLLPAH